ncbi:MAG TPA: type 1 glutamine amidotransferase domain-containing protein [Candidatus Limnocylindrales bacterium]|nr:type 1 glutamine amidotransferase domain-containing protein [Candidatus Limnocylindrales bacterium]
MIRKVALLVEDLYNEMEFWYPFYRFREAGYEVVVVGTGRKAVYNSKVGLPVQEMVAARDADPGQFAAVIISGGYAPDYMRRDVAMVDLVREVFRQGGVVAAICHAPWMLASADLLRGKRATSVLAIKDDVVNAGAEYVDAEVVVDGNLITSRTPDDLPAFCRAILKQLE